jgi:DNA-binding response OmpR family regulator
MATTGGTVLLVEDEPSVGELVRGYLARDGYTVLWVRSGEEAIVELGRHPVRLVLLDIGLPDTNGFDVCREIRQRSQVPIVMLTARDEEPDRIVGFELGADDYVTKPFSPRELVARIRAILRRSEPSTKGGANLLRVGDVEVDLDRHEVRLDGQVVALAARELDLLAYLAQNEGLVLSRRQLLDGVWGADGFGDDRTVDVHVRQLRKKLGDVDVDRPGPAGVGQAPDAVEQEVA